VYKFENISDINFSYFLSYPDHPGKMFEENGNQINIIFSKRNPAQILTGSNEGKLNIVYRILLFILE
jgi:hypothetical protein